MIFGMHVLASGCSWSGVCCDEIQFLNSNAQFANVVDGLFQLPLESRSAVVRVRHILKGVAVPEVSNMRPRL